MEKKKTSKLSRAVLMGITLIILLVPLCLYYVFYVASQKGYFTDRSHRSLASIGKQIASRVEGLRSVVEHKVKKDCNDTGDGSQALGDLGGYFNRSTLRPFGVELKFELGKAQAEEGKQPSPAQAGTKTRSKTGEETPREAPKPPLALEFTQDGFMKLIYNSDGGGDFRKGSFSVAAAMNELLTPLVDRYVIDDRRADREDLFDKVFVADYETGIVVFQRGLESITVSNLDDILSPVASDSSERKSSDQQTTGASSDKSEEAQKANDKKNEKKGDKDGEDSASARKRRGSSGLTTIKLAETEHKLFLEPIQLTLAKEPSRNPQGIKLTVCGLVRSDHFLKKTFSFSYTLLLMAVLGVLITALSGPLIKLRLLGPKDRLRRADVVLTACAAFFGTALLTLALLDLFTYGNLENEIDEQLELLAGNIDSNLRRELFKVVDQLEALNAKSGEDLSVAVPEAECPAGPRTGRNADDCEKKSAGTRYYMEDILGDDGILDPRTALYPYFNNAMWVDTCGKQKIKFTTKRKHTPFITVDERRYFKNAKDGKLWDLTSANGAEHRKLYLEALNSRLSGENVAVISKLTPLRDSVSALDTRLLSLYQPVLPTGYGFCVIDNTGLVLFDADDVKNLEENFFDECSNDKLLRSAVELRTSEPVNVQYLGRAHRAYVTPIKDLPWTLVVFRDKQILRTINLEIMTLVGIASLVYALLLIAALALIFCPIFPNSRARLIRLWPDPKRRRAYQHQALVNTLLFLICVVFITATKVGWLIAWAALFPALAVSYSFLVMARPRWFARLASRLRAGWRGRFAYTTGGRAKSGKRDWRFSYSLALVSMLAVACVAPTLAFFKLMRDQQVRVFITHGQMSLARALERRDAQVRSQYASPDPPIDVGSFRSPFIANRLDCDLDVYDDFFFRTSRKEERAGLEEPSAGLICWFLTKFSPFYNETCVESHELVRDRSSDFRWVSGEQGNNLVLVLRPISGAGDQKATPRAPPASVDQLALAQAEVEAPARWVLTSTVPSFIGGPLIVVLVVALAGMLWAAYLAVRFAARRLLLLDVDVPRPISEIPPDPAAEKNYLLICPPYFRDDNYSKPNDPAQAANEDVFPADRFRRIDLGSIDSKQGWRRATNLDDSSPGLPVVLDRFEAKRDDASWNRLKLELVERLLTNGRRVVIVSSIDPVTFPLSTHGSKGDTAAEPDSSTAKSQAKDTRPTAVSGDQADVERWSVALASFVRAHTFVKANRSSFPELYNAVGAGDSPWRYLERLGARVSPSGASASELIAEVGDQAQPYYRAVWTTCSLDERVTLFRVAQDGLASRFDPDLRRLMQRGLIVRDPSLRLMDESFRAFVLSVSVAEGVHTYRADLDSHWERLKAPLLILLLGVIAFLFLTQKELYDSTISLVSALTGGVFVLLKLFGMFQRGKDAGAAQG